MNSWYSGKWGAFSHSFPFAGPNATFCNPEASNKAADAWRATYIQTFNSDVSGAAGEGVDPPPQTIWDQLTREAYLGFQAEFGNDFEASLQWVWEEHAMEEIAAVGNTFYRSKGKSHDSWDKFFLQQQSVSEITETVSVVKLNGLRGASQPQLAGTYRWVWGFLPKELRDALFAAYDPKAVLWAQRFEANEAQWTSFAEKVNKRKGEAQRRRGRVLHPRHRPC